MADIEEIKRKIADTEAKLKKAEGEEDREMILVLNARLTKQTGVWENLLTIQASAGLQAPGLTASAHPTASPLGKRGTGKQQSLTKKLIQRCNRKEDARRCEICDVPSAVFEAAHLFDQAREKEYTTFFYADRDHMPIGINDAENGVLICPNCHSYFHKKPRRLLHIKGNGTIELTGLAKEQNYAGLHGKKVPWADKINKKDWPSSALLEVVYHLPPKSSKRKGTDLDEGIVDATDLPASTSKKGKATTAKKGKRKGTDLDEGIVNATDLPASTSKKGKAATPRKGKAIEQVKRRAARKP